LTGLYAPIKLEERIRRGSMVGKTLTRADLGEAVRRRMGLSRTESDKLVNAIIDAIGEAVVAGEPVRLSSFGTFTVRQKGARVGRNPKTGLAAPITPRRVLVFRPSPVMTDRINATSEDGSGRVSRRSPSRPR
jgi:integration host factor subunit alpha